MPTNSARPASEGEQWLNLPEYLLSHWGGARVAEYTNATHTQLVELYKKQWSREIFNALHLDLASAPKLVPPGTDVGKLSGPLAELPAFADTTLIAPACHDTASAIAGIPATGNDWAYISSGTWSLVGTLIEQPRNGAAAGSAENFTNLGAVGGPASASTKTSTACGSSANAPTSGPSTATPGIYPRRQELRRRGSEQVPCPAGLLDVDDPDLLLPERMPQRINAQRVKRGFEPLDESPANAPAFASLIFHSLAARLRHRSLTWRRLPHRQAPQAPLHRRRSQARTPSSTA